MAASIAGPRAAACMPLRGDQRECSSSSCGPAPVRRGTHLRRAARRFSPVQCQAAASAFLDTRLGRDVRADLLVLAPPARPPAPPAGRSSIHLPPAKRQAQDEQPPQSASSIRDVRRPGAAAAAAPPAAPPAPAQHTRQQQQQQPGAHAPRPGQAAGRSWQQDAPLEAMAAAGAARAAALPTRGRRASAGDAPAPQLRPPGPLAQWQGVAASDRRHGWTRLEQLQGWRQVEGEGVARLADGSPYLVTSSSGKARALAAALCRHAKAERRVVLSAVGNSSLRALQALALLPGMLGEAAASQLRISIDARLNPRHRRYGDSRVFSFTIQLVGSCGAAAPVQAVASGSSHADRSPGDLLAAPSPPGAWQPPISSLGGWEHHPPRPCALHAAEALLLPGSAAPCGCVPADGSSWTRQGQQSAHIVLAGRAPAAVCHGSEAAAPQLLAPGTAHRRHSSRASERTPSSKRAPVAAAPAPGAAAAPQRGGHSAAVLAAAAAPADTVAAAAAAPAHAPAHAGASAASELDVLSTAMQLKLHASSVWDLADAIEAGVQDSPAVVLPLAFSKHACRVLEAAVLASWRLQQRHRGEVLLLMATAGAVERQKGAKRGVHLYMFSSDE